MAKSTADTIRSVPPCNVQIVAINIRPTLRMPCSPPPFSALPLAHPHPIPLSLSPLGPTTALSLTVNLIQRIRTIGVEWWPFATCCHTMCTMNRLPRLSLDYHRIAIARRGRC